MRWLNGAFLPCSPVPSDGSSQRMLPISGLGTLVDVACTQLLQFSNSCRARYNYNRIASVHACITSTHVLNTENNTADMKTQTHAAGLHWQSFCSEVSREAWAHSRHASIMPYTCMLYCRSLSGLSCSAVVSRSWHTRPWPQYRQQLKHLNIIASR